MPRKPVSLPPECVYPAVLSRILRRDKATIWRMECSHRLPKRDFTVNGEAIGWRPATLLPVLAERGIPVA